jgi:hypothetical protein
MPIIINLETIKDDFLLDRIYRAQDIELLLWELEEITIKIAKGEASQDDIDLSHRIEDVYLVNATDSFRRHMEGSGSNVLVYRNANAMTIRTIALDFLRSIQMATNKA